MPYIRQLQRARLENGGLPEPQDVGELNYLITKLCVNYISNNKDPHYVDFNDVMGVLESAKLEFYRIYVAPYEDRKRHVNGPV